MRIWPWIAAPAAFVVLMCLGGAWLVHKQDVERDVEDANRWKWYQAHQCQPDGYVGGRSTATRVYRCNDGVQYIWQHIPSDAQ